MFPERLKNLRKEMKLTQKQIAEHFNTSQQSYGQWEKGTRKPNQESIEKLALFFNVSTDYLLGNTEIKNHSIIDETKLDEAIDKSLGFNGKPATESEKASMKEALMIYLESLKK